MISNIKKLPFPDFLATLNYVADIDNKGITEEGESNVGIHSEGRCIFSEKAKKVITSDEQEITLIGTVIIKGDIAPDLEVISSGIITVANKKMQIYSASRPRNPDGTVHHTTLEVM